MFVRIWPVISSVFTSIMILVWSMMVFYHLAYQAGLSDGIEQEGDRWRWDGNEAPFLHKSNSQGGLPTWYEVKKLGK